MKHHKPYIDFIRYSITTETEPPFNCNLIDWNDYLKYCSRQGIIGLVFDGLQRSNLKIEKTVLFKWLSFYQSIKAQNVLVNKRIRQITKLFEQKGFRSCILKGQANGQMYPHPEIRCSGDIDIWIEGQKDNIIKIVRDIAPNAKYSIHHIKMPIFKDVSVEVHYRPIYLTNWFDDGKLQRYTKEEEKRQFSNTVLLGDTEIGSLTDDFNVVYQLLHMFAHFCSTRNNFKQFIDYYYLLQRNINIQYRKECEYWIRSLGLYKYASGIMWIMSAVLGLENRFLILEANEKEGKLILEESFYFGTWSKNKFSSVIEQFVANFRIVTHYPKEVLISPFFLLWHQLWKLNMRFALRRKVSIR